MNDEETNDSPARQNVEEEFMPIHPQSQSGIDLAATSDFLKWAIDSTEKLERIEHVLKGEIPILKKLKTGQPYVAWEEKAGRRIINDEGTQKIIFMIRPFFDKETAMANIGSLSGEMEVDEAHRITEMTMYVINDAVYRNIKRWQVDETLYCSLNAYLNNEIYLTLTRVKGGGISKVIKPTLHRFETYVKDEKKKKGLFSFLSSKDK